MGSFRLAVIPSHLHENFNFIELILETVEQSLRHSCRSELTRQGISLPLDRHGYSRRLLKFQINAKNVLFSLTSTGQASDLIHHITISQGPVFLINSRYSLFYATYFFI